MIIVEGKSKKPLVRAFQMIHYFLLALVNPFGRLPPFSFAILAVVLAAAHLWVFGQLAYQPHLETWNPYTITLFAMLWMQFCIFSRRLRDTGNSGVILFPFLILAVLAFLTRLDPEYEHTYAENSFLMGLVIDNGLRIVRALYIAGLIYGIRAQGEDGPNAYGPEFGDRTIVAPSATSPLVAAATSQPSLSIKRGPRPKKEWGRRERPAGFGRR